MFVEALTTKTSAPYKTFDYNHEYFDVTVLPLSHTMRLVALGNAKHRPSTHASLYCRSTPNRSHSLTFLTHVDYILAAFFAITVLWHYIKCLFLCLRLCQQDSMFCYVLAVVVGSLCVLGLSPLTSLLRGIVIFELCILFLVLSAQGFSSPLVVLKQTTDLVATSNRVLISLGHADSAQTAAVTEVQKWGQLQPQQSSL